MRKIALVLVAAIVILGCKPENKKIAKVAGEKITQGEFDLELERLKKIAVPADYEMTEEESKILKSQVLNSMIQKKMFEKKLNELEIAADERQVEQMMDQLKSQYPSEETMNKDIQEKGFSLEEIKEEFTYRARLNALSQYIDGLESTATEEELKAYYDDNIDSQFTEYGTISARHILINKDKGEEEALKRIIEIRGEIDEGMSFAEAATKYSQGPSGQNGGQLPPFKKGQMVEEFYNAAVMTSVNTISDPVLTQYGYHIILVENKTENTVVPYEETVEYIHAQLKQTKFLEEVEEEAKIVKPDWAEEE